MRPLVKICGITRIEDARISVGAGADFLGLVFVRDSPRYVDPDAAHPIVEIIRLTAGGRTRFVGVFRNEEPSRVRSIARRLGLDLVQLHGDETNDEVSSLGVPAIKALRVTDRLPNAAPYRAADWILFDTDVEGVTGGSGKRFDWKLLSGGARPRGASDAPVRVPEAPVAGMGRFFLAGGLDPDNVNDAIELVRPDAIDVSSGVEESPGIKSREKVERLLRRVKTR